MEYANVSVKFPKELDNELEGFLDETGVYTNKSEFIKESVRRHLIDLNNEPAIAALRVEQLLGRAEESTITDDDLEARLDELRQQVDATEVENAVETAREETAAEHIDHA